MGKISYKKGKDFENEVAKFIVEEMKYDDAEVRPIVSGKTSDKGFEVDVLAKINDKGSANLQTASTLCLIFGLIILGACVFKIFDGAFPLFLSFTFIGISIFYFSCGKRLMAKYVWCECKNLKNRVNRNQIIELVYKYNDYQKQEEKRWNIIAKAYFSASGYNADAKSFAKENNVICYEKNDKNKFVKTNLDF